MNTGHTTLHHCSQQHGALFRELSCDCVVYGIVCVFFDWLKLCFGFRNNFHGKEFKKNTNKWHLVLHKSSYQLLWSYACVNKYQLM